MPAYPATNWTTRSYRSVPHIPVPSLPSVAQLKPAMNHLKRLAVFLIFRPLVGASILATSLARGWWIAVLPATWLTYGSALAAVHQLIHASLGLSPRARRFWISTLAMVVAESGHALQATHLAHHRGAPDHPDPEGSIENLNWRQTPVGALAFRYRLAFWGLQNSPRRRRIRIEMGVHAGLHLASLAMLPVSPALWLYLTMIHFASFVFAVLAGKGPQTNWGRPIKTPFVRVTTHVGRALLFSHDRHLEHHMYPKVPLSRLRRIATTTDRIAEDLQAMTVRFA